MAYSGRILGIKKMLRSLYLVAAVLLLNAACATSDCPPVNLPEANARHEHGVVSLTGQFLQYLNTNSPEQNSVASAASLMVPLAQLTLWAQNGPILNDLLKVLNLQCKDEIRVVFRNLIAGFKDLPKVEFEMATKYYAHQDYPLTTGFKSASKVFFDAEGENIDFSQPQNAADTINTWILQRTRGKIQDLVKAEMFDDHTRLTLVNAVYFLGTWVKQFPPLLTSTSNFYKNNGEVVPLKMMYQRQTFNYAGNEKFQVLEMVYQGNNFSMVVVLPRNKEDLLSTLATVSDPFEWDNIMQSLRPERVDVHLPKMLIKTNIDLKPLLARVGLGSIFNPNYGFEGVLENGEPLFITDAVQQAYIQVDEAGTEAAATSVLIPVSATIDAVPPKDFNANHPYLYFLVFNKIPLFSGTFVGAQ